MKEIPASAPESTTATDDGNDDAPSSPREIELKLYVPAGQVARLWSAASIAAHAVGPRGVSLVANRYFDTPRRELACARMALRLRRIGRRWVQTLKTSGSVAGALSTRGEWEMPVAGPALQLARFVGTPLLDIASPRVLAHRLQPVFTTDFRRESQRLRIADGLTIELVFDRGTIAVGRGRSRRTAAICEVEMEIVAAESTLADRDAEDALLRFAVRLAREVSLVPLAESKAARGYRLADNGWLAPSSVMVPQPDRAVTARRHLARVLVACNAALLENVHALFEDLVVDGATGVDTAQHRIDCVHQARVAIRRMRCALRLFKPVAKTRRVAALDDALKRIGAVFGAVRDHDVVATETMDRLAKAFGTDEAGREAFAAVRLQLAERRAAAQRALAAELDGGLLGAVTLSVERLALRLDRAGAGGVPLVERADAWLARQYDRVIVRARRLAALDRDARHDLRIEVKRLRYALDLLESFYDAVAVERFGDALAGLQKRLGKLNDETVALMMLQALDRNDAQVAAIERYGRWLAGQIADQLPKIAARSVALELTPRPWSTVRSRAFD